MAAGLDVTVDIGDFRDLYARIKAEVGNGTEGAKVLRRDLAREFRAAAKPAAAQARSNILGMASRGPGGSPGLRTTIAAAVKVEVRSGGRNVGVRISAKKTPGLRGFTNAARHTNARSWRHPVHGNADRWVTQRGEPDWFSGPMRRLGPGVREAAGRAVAALRDRLM